MERKACTTTVRRRLVHYHRKPGFSLRNACASLKKKRILCPPAKPQPQGPRRQSCATAPRRLLLQRATTPFLLLQRQLTRPSPVARGRYCQVLPCPGSCRATERQRRPRARFPLLLLDAGRLRPRPRPRLVCMPSLRAVVLADAIERAAGLPTTLINGWAQPVASACDRGRTLGNFTPPITTSTNPASFAPPLCADGARWCRSADGKRNSSPARDTRLVGLHSPAAKRQKNGWTWTRRATPALSLEQRLPQRCPRWTRTCPPARQKWRKPPHRRTMPGLPIHQAARSKTGIRMCMKWPLTCLTRKWSMGETARVLKKKRKMDAVVRISVPCFPFGHGRVQTQRDRVHPPPPPSLLIRGPACLRFVRPDPGIRVALGLSARVEHSVMTACCLHCIRHYKAKRCSISFFRFFGIGCFFFASAWL